MECVYYGGNCLGISGKKARIIVDDNLSELGLPGVSKPSDIALFTQKPIADKASAKDKPYFVINSPGEYEVSNISVNGIAARAHTGDPDSHTATIYKIIVDDIRVVVTGHIYPDLTGEQLESIGTVDVLCIPVGGNGYTLDGTGAIGIIKKVNPKIVIPTYYADKAIKYPVPPAELKSALQAMSMEPSETLDSFKPKALELIENTRLVVLNRQSK